MPYKDSAAAYRRKHPFTPPPDLPGEEWRSVPNYEGLYECSNFGRFKRIGRGKGSTVGAILKPYFATPNWYPLVHLSRNGIHKPREAHQFVARAFIGEPPTPLHEVNHKDADKTNCHASNLEWVTHPENARHAVRLGLIVGPRLNGEMNPHAILTDVAVREIRRIGGSLPRRVIAERYGITGHHVGLILRRKAWRHLE